MAERPETMGLDGGGETGEVIWIGLIWKWINLEMN